GRPRWIVCFSGHRRTLAHRIRRERRQTTSVVPPHYLLCRHRGGCVYRTHQFARHPRRLRWTVHDRLNQRDQRELHSRTLPRRRYADSVRRDDHHHASRRSARRCRLKHSNPKGAPAMPHPDQAKRNYKIAVIPGDGIGREVVPEGVRVLEAAAKQFGFRLQLDEFDFASCDYYLKHNKMVPDDWKERIGRHDAIFFGAVGWPEKVPDHISLWGSLILFRREFDQYVNLRPVRLMPGVPCPLAGRKPGDIDFWVVRENTEGEYSSIGGRMFAGTEREVCIQETVMSRIGVDRVLGFAFELASARPNKHLTSATKSNGISITMPYWDERVKEMARRYPGV